MHHLTIRVAWHDSQWDGSICKAPKENPFCLALDRVREQRDDDAEEKLRGKLWTDLTPEQMPPCIAESGGFMTPRPWKRVFKHPYSNSPKAAATHGPLKPTVWKRDSMAEHATQLQAHHARILSAANSIPAR